MPVSAKVETRISTELKRFQTILAAAKQRDVSEADTVVILTDFLSAVLGYDKYQHITREFAIRGTYVDLAVRVDGDIRFLIEAKAIGVELKENHVKQAIDYGANNGLDWVILSNGAVWRAYKIQFTQPIDKTLVFDLDLLGRSHKDAEVIECLGSLSKEGFSRGSMADLLEQRQLTSAYTIAAALLSETLVDQLRKELRRMAPSLKVDNEYLAALLSNEVIKRELVDSDAAKSARLLVRKLQRNWEKERKVSSKPEAIAATAVQSPESESGE
ncbi:MAG TPA: restriction endonuclease subunit R [Alphaproteobacteria bacterium]|nr:restriction endonuclease subunit R [Alphaproteobacteria bacterium]